MVDSEAMMRATFYICLIITFSTAGRPAALSAFSALSFNYFVLSHSPQKKDDYAGLGL